MFRRLFILDKCVITRRKSIEELTQEVKDLFIKAPCDAVGKGISYKLPQMPPTNGSYFDVKVGYKQKNVFLITQNKDNFLQGL